jgi:hypothetical protein
MNNIKFEMHRKSAIDLKRNEYTYTDITLKKSNAILGIFKNTLSKNTEESTESLICHWEWVPNETFQKASTSSTVRHPTHHWEWICLDPGPTGGGGGGSTGGGEGGGGTGGGGCGDDPHDQDFTHYKWWTKEVSLLSPCELNEAITRLTALLGLSSGEIFFLRQWPNFAEQLDIYLTIHPQNTQLANDHIDKLTQDFDYFNFSLAHWQLGDPLKVWWEDDLFLTPYGGLNFGGWAINYISQNTAVSFSVFQNQFMGISEGQDGTYDATYWDDPNLTFPPQTLPTWANFNAAFPKHDDPLLDDPSEMYTSIGGQVLSQYNTAPTLHQNTCALRVSKALNYSGVTIPAGTDRYQGSDGKYYFLSAKALLIWMKKTFGTPTGGNHLTGAQGGVNGENFPSLLAGKKGIYMMTPNYPGLFASGHADMIENSVCDGNCYFNTVTGGIFEIYIWELQ